MVELKFTNLDNSDPTEVELIVTPELLINDWRSKLDRLLDFLAFGDR